MIPAAGGEVVVTWPRFDLDGATTGRLLQDAGLTIRLEPKTGRRTGEEMIRVVGDAVAVIASSDPFDASLFSGCPNLRVIARTGVGVDAIDLEAATEAGVVVATAPGTNEEAVADHTLALILALVRRIPEHDASMRERRWDRAGRISPGDLYSATVGLVGCGTIGRAVVRRLSAFGSRVLVHDPALAEAPKGTTLVSLTELLESVDVVALHCPLTAETRGLIGASELARMRQDAVLVNAARGHLVDEAALADALRSGRLQGAALDVFAEEPPFDSELLELPNIILTPHVAGLSHTAIEAMVDLATQSVLAVLGGELPPSPVNPEAL